MVPFVAVNAMSIQLDLGALKMTRWSEYALRFFFGGAITVITGVLAERYGPEFGGLFLAFPALFAASATLIEKHERERKRRVGISKTVRGRQAAALDARGVTMGSIGLIGFALVVWKLLPIWNVAFTLVTALAVWLVISILIWWGRKSLC
jgi:succinate-acetate transporter protein